MKSLYLAVLVLFPVTFLFAQTIPVSQFADNAQRLVLQGTQLIRSRPTDCHNLSLAQEDYEKAASLDPDEASIHFQLANALAAQGLPNIGNCAHTDSEREVLLDRAWSESRTALDIDGKNVLYRGEFVALSELLKRKPEYNGGIAVEPNKNEISKWLADHPSAVSSEPSDSNSLESLESLTNNALDAEHNEEIASTQDAVTDAKEAIRAQPTDGFAWGKLGSAYLDLGDYKDAQEATKKAVEIFNERFKNAPPPVLDESNEASTDLSMLGVYYQQLAEISEKLHKRREARRYRDLALRTFDLLRMIQPSSDSSMPQTRVQQPETSNQTQTQTVPASPPSIPDLPRPAGPCPPPVHETCQMPPFNPQPYDPDNPQPYKAPDMRGYDRCMAENQREDARYQQCVQLEQHEQH